MNIKLSHKEKINIRNKALLRVAKELLESSSVKEMLIKETKVIERTRELPEIIDNKIIIGDKIFQTKNISNDVQYIKDTIIEYKKEHKRRIEYYSKLSKKNIIGLKEQISSILKLKANEFFNIQDREVDIKVEKKKAEQWLKEKDEKINFISELENDLKIQKMMNKQLQDELKLKNDYIEFYEHKLKFLETK